MNIVFPKDSLFDSYLLYGIDKSKSLKKVKANGISSIALEASALEDTPISILNRKDLNSLILVTKSAATSQYTVTIVNTATDTKVYSKSWTSAQYDTNFIAELSSEGNFVLLKDGSGFLLLLQFETANSVVTVTEITLEKA